MKKSSTETTNCHTPFWLNCESVPFFFLVVVIVFLIARRSTDDRSCATECKQCERNRMATPAKKKVKWKSITSVADVGRFFLIDLLRQAVLLWLCCTHYTFNAATMRSDRLWMTEVLSIMIVSCYWSWNDRGLSFCEWACAPCMRSACCCLSSLSEFPGVEGRWLKRTHIQTHVRMPTRRRISYYLTDSWNAKLPQCFLTPGCLRLCECFSMDMLFCSQIATKVPVIVSHAFHNAISLNVSFLLNNRSYFTVAFSTSI